MKDNNDRLSALIDRYLERSTELTEVGILRYKRYGKMTYTHVCIWEDLWLDFIPYYMSLLEESFACSNELSKEYVITYIRKRISEFKEKNPGLHDRIIGVNCKELTGNHFMRFYKNNNLGNGN